MKPRINLKGNTIDEIWEQISEAAVNNNLYNFHAVAKLDGQYIELDIVSSPGGGTGGGYSYTTLSADLPDLSDFHFVVYPEDFLNKIGKLFGIQDVKIGYPDLDKYLIIKTNDAVKLKEIFSDSDIRKEILAFSGFSLKVEQHDDKSGGFAEFTIQRALIDPAVLRMFFEIFLHVTKSAQR